MTDTTPEQTTQRPVVVYYSRDVAPTPDHPDGFVQGQTFVVTTPEAAKAVHPDADIVRYEDGAPFSVRKSNAEIRARDAEQDPTPDPKPETPAETPKTDDAKTSGKAS